MEPGPSPSPSPAALPDLGGVRLPIPMWQAARVLGNHRLLLEYFSLMSWGLFTSSAQETLTERPATRHPAPTTHVT